MSLYRGAGGASDATDDSTVNAVAGYASSAASSATAAAASASTASGNASAAAASAASAATSVSQAAASAATAESASTFATGRATSAFNSAASATSAASAANVSAGSAATSAANAATSNSSASTHATNAANSATAAAGSATASANSAASALAIYGNTAAMNEAVADAVEAAANAQQEAQDASDSAVASAASAAAADEHENNAAEWASQAQGSANSAQGFATAAQAARDATLEAYDNFDDRYLGVKTSDPTVDNDGNLLVPGALYFNSSTNMMMLRAGGVWVAAYTSGGSPSFGNTVVNGTLNVTGVSTFSAGTAAAPAITTTGDTNTGIFFPAADTIAFSEGGVESMRINSAGNLGLGSIAPVGYTGYVGATIQSTNGGFINIRNTANTNQMEIAVEGGGNTSYVKTVTSMPLTFGTNNIERMRLDASGNLGLGTSSPNTRLTIGGYSSANQTPDIQINRSSSGTAIQTGPNITFADGTTNNTTTLQVTQGRFGVWNYGSGVWAERMSIDTSGNLGLGVTPTNVAGTRKLEVGGTTGAALVLNTASGNTAARNWATAANSNVFGDFNILQSNALGGDPIAAGTARMTFSPAGNVGIGTTSPATRLQVGNATGLQQALVSGGGYDLVLGASGGSIFGFASQAISTVFNTTAVPLGIGTSASQPLLFGTANTERMRLDASGNLGLGVTPSAWSGVQGVFEIRGNAYLYSTTGVLSSGANAFFNGTNWIYKTTQAATRYEQVNGAHRWDTAPSGTAGNAITFTQAMTLDASGNLGIGTTSPATRLDVAANGETIRLRGDGTSTTNPSIRTDTSTNPNGNVRNALGAVSSSSLQVGYVGTLSNHPLTFFVNDAERARITTGGNLLVGATAQNAQGRQEITFDGAAAQGLNIIDSSAAATSTAVSFIKSAGTRGTITVTASATAYNTSSDYRLKNISGPVTNSGAYIDSLNPVEGTWKVDGSPFVGLIAHEVQEASRTAVATGVKDGEEMQGMDYSNSELIANLIAEVKSLRARVAALESN